MDGLFGVGVDLKPTALLQTKVCYTLWKRREVHMSTEERVTALERSLVATQSDFLLHLGEINQSMATLNKVVTAQELHSREVNHNVTMLLGVTSGQERDIKAIKNDLGFIKERVEQIDRRLESIEGRFTSLDEKVEQVLRQLAALTQ